MQSIVAQLLVCDLPFVYALQTTTVAEIMLNFLE